MYEYLQDSNFLDKLENMNIKIQYVKLIILDFAEIPIREIQGQVQGGGTINVNGSSSLRRTISFTMFADINTNDLTNIDNLISLNKKIKVEIGYKNLIKGYEHYGDIIWFKGGTYIISSASISNSTSGSNISIQAKDKMVMLNGMAGGTIPMALVLHERYEEVKNDDGTTTVLITYPTLFQIIYEVVSQFGGEPTTNIIISDLTQSGKMLVKYIGDKKFYLHYNLESFYEFESLEELKNKIGEDKAKDYYEYTYGQDVGYQETDFTFPGDLTFAAGSTVTQVLDKICQTFGNYEYFYDLDGRFIFQEKKNYLNNAYTPITDLGTKQYVKQFSDSKYLYTFKDMRQVISINASPKYENLKNDFIVWGQRTSASGSSLPIRYHLAIDEKPPIKLAGKYMYEVTDDNKQVERYQFMDEELKTLPDNTTLIGYPCGDWREELYRQALIRQKDGATPNIYDNELLTEWRKLYDPTNLEWRSGGSAYSSKDNYWNPLVFTSPGSLDYWLDFLDDGDDLRKYSCSAIGRRTKVVNDNNVTSIFNGEVQDVLFIENVLGTASNDIDLLNAKIEKAESLGQKYIIIQPEDKKLFSISSTGASAFDVMRETIYQSLVYNNSITITCTPKYYLEPNHLINIQNNNNGVSGDYVISSFSLPLNYNGTMSITAIEALTRI